MREYVSYENIPRLLRDLRVSAGRTQEAFAKELASYGTKVDRFKIIKVERGHTDLGKELAIALDSFAESEALKNAKVPTYGFASLVGERDAFVVDREGGIDLSKLLSAADLTELYVVLCDESDLAYHVRSGLRTATGGSTVSQTVPRKIVLVVPSRERVDELFGMGAAAGLQERGEFFGGYADRLWRHLLVQIHRFERLAGQSEGVDVEVFVSRAVLNPVVVAKSRQRANCLAWSCTPSRDPQGQPEIAPIVARPDLTTWYEHQIRSMIAGESILARRQHFCDTFLVPSDAASEERSGDSGVRSISRVRFSRFLPRQKLGKYELAPGEGLAVAMVLPYVRTMHAAEVRGEVLLKRRSTLLSGAESEVDGQLAFVATRVTASCMWDAIDSVEVPDRSSDDHSSNRLHRSQLDMTMHHEDQSAEMVDRLNQVSEPAASGPTTDSVSRAIDDAYKLAAMRELQDTYGATFDGVPLAERLELIDFGDIAIPKSNQTAIIPRLFKIRLEPDERDDLIALASRNDGNEIERLAIDTLLKLTRAARNNCFDTVAEEEGVHEFDDSLKSAITDPRLSLILEARLVAMRDEVQRPRR